MATAFIPGSINDEITTDDNEDQSDVQEIGMLPAFVMSINFIIGAGFFSMPFVFYHGGILVGMITLFVVTGTLILTSNWTLEVCSRAQALEHVIRESDIPGLTFYDVSIVGRRYYTKDSARETLLPPKPKYEIVSSRKFEFTELMEIFFGLPGRIITAVSIIVYLLVTLTAYATIFGSTWALVLPYNVSHHGKMVLESCHLEDFVPLLPTGTCLNTYRFSLMIFACIVVPICVMNVNTMKPFQVGLSFAMQLTILSGTIHSLYGVVTGKLAGGEGGDHPNRFLSFDFKSFLGMIPIVVYSQVLHEGIPLIAQPARDKKNLHKMFAGALSYACVVYTMFSVMAALRYREDIAPCASLNWAVTAKRGNNIFIRILSYLILMTPSLVVCTAFPLCAMTLVANAFILLTGKDCSNEPRFKIIFKCCTAATALSAITFSFFISNLKTLSKYAGLAAFLLIMFYPIMLQVASRRKCRRVFGKVDEWIEESIIASSSWREEDRLPLLDRYAKIRDIMTMTPYYSSWWSRTWVVAMATVISIIFFVFGVLSTFMTPSAP